ncbi:MAG: hypothetical protein ACK4FS_08110 [Flavobacterium sp.]
MRDHSFFYVILPKTHIFEHNSFSMMSTKKRLFLLDAYALIFRGYYAFIKNPKINSTVRTQIGNI